MADLSQIREHMEVIGADGARVGTVDSVEGDRIKLTKADSGSHAGHHHYIAGGLVATIEGDKVRLSANGDAATLLEEEKSGSAIFDSAVDWKKVGVGAAAVAGVAAVAGAVMMKRRSGEGSGAEGERAGNGRGDKEGGNG
jgi:hypothetical protein